MPPDRWRGWSPRCAPVRGPARSRSAWTCPSFRRGCCALGALLEGHTAVVPVPRARTQPLAAWYAPAALEPLAAALGRGERALVPAVLALDPRLVADDELAALGAAPESFLNVNTPEDLASAVRVRGAGHRA